MMKINIKIEGISSIDYTFEYDRDISELDLLKILVSATEKVGEKISIPPISDISIVPKITLENVKNKIELGKKKYNRRLNKGEWNRVLSEVEGGRITLDELEKQGYNRGTVITKLYYYKRNNFSI